MFKNMKLATKMALGFGILVVLCAVLGVVSWTGLDGVGTMAQLDQQGAQCLDTLNRCASLRRDFALRGFKKAEGQSKNAAELWHEAADELVVQLETLRDDPDFDARKRADVEGLLKDSTGYKKVFAKQADARTMQDEGFAAWGEIGWAVTENIQKVIKDVIEPARAAAEEAQQIDEIVRWASISDRLDKDVIQPFLLLRVTAVYLLATNEDAQWEGYQKQLETAKAGLASWTELVAGEARLEQVASALQGYFTNYAAAGAKYREGILQTRTADTEMASLAKQMVTTMGSVQSGLRSDAEAITARTNTLVIGTAISAILIGIVLAVVITRSIVKPISRVIAHLNEGADQVNDAAGQVATASQQLAEGASEQASSLEETSSALEEMAAMTRTNAENAKEANGLSADTRRAAESGDQTMTQLNDAMTGINSSAGQISKIIKVIEEIAFQTNLLALNAAVEAARAGEHGKGFAVVADEVRNLAQRAAQASGEITQLIEESVEKAREGTSVAQDVGEALGSIVGNVTKVADLIDGISRASDEQAQGVDQLNVAVSQMDKVTQQNAASAEESASAAEELSAQANTVKATVDELSGIIGGNAAARNEQTRKPATRPASPQPAATVSVKPAQRQMESTSVDSNLDEF